MRALYACLLLAACTEYGPELSESGTVTETCYVPPGHGNTTGFDSNGGVSFGSVHIPARYGVVFACRHGQFAVNSEAVWLAVTKGDEVVIYYREVLEDGRAVDLDFLRAERLAK
jgi:hypothetical protein